MPPHETDHDILIELRADLRNMSRELKEVKILVENEYVGRDKFNALVARHDRLEKIVYSIVSIPLVGFISALSYLVWSKGQ